MPVYVSISLNWRGGNNFFSICPSVSHNRQHCPCLNLDPCKREGHTQGTLLATVCYLLMSTCCDLSGDCVVWWHLKRHRNGAIVDYHLDYSYICLLAKPARTVIEPRLAVYCASTCTCGSSLILLQSLCPNLWQPSPLACLSIR